MRFRPIRHELEQQGQCGDVQKRSNSYNFFNEVFLSPAFILYARKAVSYYGKKHIR